jgi:endonuclease YncB( thermonuclease family)
MNKKASFFKHRLTLFILAGLTTFLFSSFSFAREPIRTVTGTVTKVSDGDSIHVTTPEQTILKVRLYGIDAPETPKINRRTGHVNITGQPYGKESWKALKSKLMGKQVRLDILDIDKYRRMVCMVWLDSRNINLEMVREGYAEAFLEYLKEPYRSQFMRAEMEARSEKRGIWSLPDYERPRDFRKRLKVRGN